MPFISIHINLYEVTQHFKAGIRQRAPPHAQQRKGDIRFGENLDNHSSNKTHIQT